MPTLNSNLIRKGSMAPLPIKLPNGFGIGALRHQLAEATIATWTDIIPGATAAEIKNHPTLFLGKAADSYELLDANAEWTMTEEVKQAAQHAITMPGATYDSLEAAVADTYKEILIKECAKYLNATLLSRGMTLYAPTTDWTIQ